MTSLISPAKPDIFAYHPVEELLNMSLAEVERLWELVPTERQRQYRTIYDRFIRNEGVAGSDAMELQAVTQILVKYYVQEHMVPVLPNGEIWVRVPKQVREAAAANAESVHPDLELHNADTRKRPIVPLLIMGGCLLIFAFLAIRGMSSSGRLGATATLKPTSTPLFSPTPTPIALDAQDAIIQSGDTSSRNLTVFPVNLRVVQGTDRQPRVFIVQRKIIQTTEWNYIDNPDTASYISGLVIRPVLGIPWSSENAALFENMTSDTTFMLQMNTGSSQRFTFESRHTVNRSDTSAFRQNGPGLVLVLIGERNPETSEPTSNRIVVVAKYVADAELNGDTVITGLDLPKVDTPTPTLTPTPSLPNIGVDVISVTTRPNVATFRLRIFNARYNPLRLDKHSIFVIYGYQNHPTGPKMAAEVPATDVLPGQALDLVVNFAWHGEPFGTLLVLADYQYAVAFSK